MSSTEEKLAAIQSEIESLAIAAKSSKMNADEARAIRAQIAAFRRDVAAACEQRAAVAELFEKRELQLANVAADVSKNVPSPFGWPFFVCLKLTLFSYNHLGDEADA